MSHVGGRFRAFVPTTAPTMRAMPAVAAVLGAVLLVTLVTTGCTSGRPDSGEVIRVLAASSLANTLEQVNSKFTDKTGVSVELISDASSRLALQLEQGFAADLFLSADRSQIERVIRADRVAPETVSAFGSNRLVGVAAAAGPGSERFDASQASQASQSIERSSADGERLPPFLFSGRVVTAAVGVPLRSYTGIALQRAVAAGDLTAHQVEEYLNRIVSEEGNARQVLLKVLLGGADGAIVYAGDLPSELPRGVRATPLPEGWQPEIRYWIAPVGDGARRPVVDRYQQYVREMIP